MVESFINGQNEKRQKQQIIPGELITDYHKEYKLKESDQQKQEMRRGERAYYFFSFCNAQEYDVGDGKHGKKDNYLIKKEKDILCAPVPVFRNICKVKTVHPCVD